MSLNGTALAGMGVTDWSNSATGTALVQNVSVSGTVPAAPSSLGDNVVSSSEIDLTWTNNATNQTGFHLDQATNSTFTTGLVTYTTTSTSYNDTGLSAGTTYYFRVRAYNGFGDSSNSNTASGTTIVAIPAAPSNLADNVVSYSEIDLTWTNNASNQTGFHVDQAFNSTFTSGLVTYSTSNTSFNDTGLTAGTTYYFQVRAYNAGGDSSNSNTVGGTTLSSGSLPNGWSDADINGSTPAGSGKYTSGTGVYTIVGGGTGYSGTGTSDQFNFASESWSGNGTIIAEVTSITPTTGNSPNCAVMFRNDTTAGSMYAGLGINGTGGLAFKTRTSANAPTTAQNATGPEYGPSPLTPIWLELADYGNSFTAYYGTGTSQPTNWYEVGTAVTVDLNSSTRVGMGATDWSTSVAATATVQNVSVALSPGPTVASAATATPSTVTGTTTGLSVLGADTGTGADSLTYTWATTSKPSGAAAPTFLANGTNAAQNTSATFSAAGAYGFTVTITDTMGLSTTSSVNVTVNQTLTSIAVSPSSVTVNVNGTQQFSATGYDQFSTALTQQPSFTWTTTVGTITSGGGLLTAPSSPGSGTVTATYGTTSGNSSVTVQSLTDTDINGSTPAGSASYNSGTGVYTVTGGGTGYHAGQTSDQFNFDYESWGGSGTIIAEVTALTPTTPNSANCAVMFRNDTTAGSMYAALGMDAGGGMAFKTRTSTNGSTSQQTAAGPGYGPSTSQPIWLKMVDSGSSFTTFYGTGTSQPSSWTEVGTATTVSLNSSYLAGLAVTEWSTTVTGTGTFHNLSIGAYQMLDRAPIVNSTAPSLQMGQLVPVEAQAVAAWEAAGLTATQISALTQVQLVITDLPGSLLGETVGEEVMIDTNAAGYGWSIGREVAPNRVDLLTVVEHELGHMLGLADINPPSRPGDLMDELLPLGVRRSISAHDVALLRALADPGTTDYLFGRPVSAPST